MARWLSFLANACIALAVAAPTHALGLSAQLFPVTGEVRLVNNSYSDISFVFYSIDSDSGALDSSSAVWKSITRNYDRAAGVTPGNGLIDINGDWLELLTGNQLAEGAIDADGGTLAALHAISLGKIWNPYEVPFPDLEFEVWNDVEMIPITVELALEGDYTNDHIVDAGDYLIWQKFLDSMSYAYYPDGDLNGVIDFDDLVIMQRNFGLTLPLPPYVLEGGGGGGSSPSIGVPEPSSAALLLISAGAAFAAYRRRR